MRAGACARLRVSWFRTYLTRGEKLELEYEDGKVLWRGTCGLRSLFWGTHTDYVDSREEIGERGCRRERRPGAKSAFLARVCTLVPPLPLFSCSVVPHWELNRNKYKF